MNKLKKVLWGRLVLVAAGILFALRAMELINFNLLFDGWWTLFIIVPCGIGLFTERDKTGNLIGIIIGIFLLLGCQNIIRFEMLWKLLIPGIIIIIGARMIFRGVFGDKIAATVSELEIKNVGNQRAVCATFSGCDMILNDEIFEGAELTAVFGGVKCDLRNAVIEKDCVIKVSAIFGGIDIFVPAGVNVRTNSTSLFGGMSNKTVLKKEGPTIYVSGTCMFGGVDIK